MHTIARTNGRALPKGFTLEKSSSSEVEGTKVEGPKGLAGLFTSKLRFITMCLWVVWMGFGLSYYGLVFLITHVVFLKDQPRSLNHNSTDYSTDYSNFGVAPMSGALESEGGVDVDFAAGSSRRSRRTSAAASDTCDFDYPSTFVNAVR